MRIRIVIGRGAYDEDAGTACDACWIEYQDIQDVPRKCQCQDPRCSLAWCDDHSSENRHMARRLHMRGLISDSDLQFDPMPNNVKKMLEVELSAYRKSLQIAPNTQDLNGVRVFESKNQWRKTWFRDEAPSWAYEESPSDPRVQKALEEAEVKVGAEANPDPEWAANKAEAVQQTDTVEP